MFKKVLAVALFLSMILTMVSVANAEDGKVASGVQAVVVYSVDNNILEYAEIIPDDGSTFGVLIPGTLDKYGDKIDDVLSVKGPYAELEGRTFQVAIVFDGIVDIAGGDALALNSSYLKADRFETTVDGLNSVLFTTFSIPHGNNVWGGNTYQLHFLQANAARSFDFSFEIKFVDTAEGSLKFNADERVEAAEVLDMLDVDFYALGDYGTSDFEYANAVVKVSTKLNVRAGASIDSAVVQQLSNGTGVYIIDYIGNWYEIVDTDGVTVGFVFDKYIELL